MSVNDYQKTIEICNDAINRLENKPFTWVAGISGFFFQKITCHTQLKEYENGKNTVLNFFKYLENGTFNWFKGQELFMYLLVHTKNYQEAYEVYKVVSDHKRFEFLPNSTKESWNIFKAYIHFLIQTQAIILEKEDQIFSKFKLGKFLNEVPTFSQDLSLIHISEPTRPY